MNIRIYNTLSRNKEPFEPVSPGKVGIYLCGPTVYDKAHIGHMVGPVAFDVIKRFLVYSGFDVCWVVNITDVDDKLIKSAQNRGLSMAAVAEEMTKDYLDNLAGMGVDQIDKMPKATECMDGIIAFTKSLIDQGFAYEAEGNVFFDVAKDAEYGKLTNRTVDQLQGEGGEVGAMKKSPADFTLWKAAKADEPSWDSPWGPGRPGWHIECSAMSRELLGESFDIHGGGLDLIFPHHENEIAQSECCHGKPMAKYWLHNGLLRRGTAGKIGGRGERDASASTDLESVQDATAAKESRSGGAGGLDAMIGEFGGETLRFFLLKTHYRSTVILDDEALAEAKTALDSFYRFFERFERVTGGSYYEVAFNRSRADASADESHPLLAVATSHRAAFIEKMDDDFNTGAAASEMFELLRSLNKFVDENDLESAGADAEATEAFKKGVSVFREMAAVLGLFMKPPQRAGGDDALSGKLMELFITLRAEARQNKDYAMSDRIRDGLNSIGVTLEDRKEGTSWRVEN